MKQNPQPQRRAKPKEGLTSATLQKEISEHQIGKNVEE